MNRLTALAVNVSKTLKGQWIFVALAVLAFDTGIRFLRESAVNFSPTWYGLSAIMSLLFVLNLDSLRLLVPRSVRPIATVILAVVVALICAIGFLTYQQFGEFVTASKLQFVVRNTEYMKAFARDYLLNVNLVWIAAGTGLIAWVWGTSSDQHLQVSPTVALTRLVTGVGVYLILLNQLAYGAKGYAVTMDSSMMLAVKHLRKAGSIGLHRAERNAVASFRARDEVNILLLVNESFGTDAFDPVDSVKPAMPFLQEWTRRSDESIVTFSNAFANSSATDVSLPSLLTGIAPYESSKMLHEQPLVWDWARASGRRSIFFSAQSYRWANFKEFFLSPGPDAFITADELRLPYANDTGVDELAAMSAFADTLIATSGDRPFFALYNSNALHAPFQQSSPTFHPTNTTGLAYRNAAGVLDEGYRRLFTRLEAAGILQNTIVIITADHGDSDSPTHPRVARIVSFYDQIMRIPFIVRFPHEWMRNNGARAAWAVRNRHTCVSNLDLLPTILDLTMPDGVFPPERARLLGRSLLGDMPADRGVIALNTNELRQWDHEGFGLYWSDLRFVYSDLEGPQLFYPDRDPKQLIDAWQNAPPAERQRVHDVVEKTFHLKRMYAGWNDRGAAAR